MYQNTSYMYQALFICIKITDMYQNNIDMYLNTTNMYLNTTDMYENYTDM